MLLESALGISISAVRQEVILHDPCLPESIADLQVTNLQVGSASLDLAFRRDNGRVVVDVLRKSGEVNVVFPTSAVEHPEPARSK
jgi:cellobiose phosphorylase